jgi:uncharacterized protein (DUF1778 family)
MGRHLLQDGIRFAGAAGALAARSRAVGRTAASEWHGLDAVIPVRKPPRAGQHQEPASAAAFGMAESAMTTSVLSVRVSKEERALLRTASELARTSLSEFIRRKALDAAELDVLERRIITIPAKDWEAFEAWANRPAEEIQGLKDLWHKTPTWEK